MESLQQDSNQVIEGQQSLQDEQQPPKNPVDATESTLNVEMPDFVTLAQQTEEKLREIWKEEGLKEEECLQQLQEIARSVADVYNQRLKDEIEFRDEMKDHVASVEGLIRDLSSELGLPCEPVPEKESGTIMQKLKWLQNHYQQLEGVKNERLSILEPLMEQLHGLWKELGQEVEKDFESVGETLDDARIMACKEKLDVLQKQSKLRKVEVKKTHVFILSIFQALDFTPETPFDKMLSDETSELKIDDESIAALSHRADELQELKIARTEELKSLGHQIQPLWELLEVPKETRQEFFEENTGFSIKVIEQCRSELRRLLETKKQMLSKLTTNVRVQIEQLWEKMMVGDEEKGMFMEHFTSTNFTDELFEKHKDELQLLSERFKTMEPILKSVEKYYSLCNERIEYEALIKDSSRLLSRRPGQLREEEQQRKRVALIPKIIAKLERVVPEYEQAHGTLFYKDEPLLDVVKANELEFQENKKMEKQAKMLAKKKVKEEELYAQLGGRTPTKKLNSSGRQRPSSAISTSSRRAPLSTRKDVDNLKKSQGPRGPGGEDEN